MAKRRKEKVAGRVIEQKDLCLICLVHPVGHNVTRCTICDRQMCEEHIRYVSGTGWLCSDCLRMKMVFEKLN